MSIHVCLEVQEPVARRLMGATTATEQWLPSFYRQTKGVQGFGILVLVLLHRRFEI